MYSLISNLQSSSIKCFLLHFLFPMSYYLRNISCVFLYTNYHKEISILDTICVIDENSKTQSSIFMNSSFESDLAYVRVHTHFILTTSHIHSSLTLK